MVPACLITGLPGADKQGFVAALAAARPCGASWALLDNDGGGSAQALARDGIATGIVSGCACCSGRITLQVGLVQLLRRVRPGFLIITADGAAEPADSQLTATDATPALQAPGAIGFVT